MLNCEAMVRNECEASYRRLCMLISPKIQHLSSDKWTVGVN
jgi:hypothetical protein